VPDGPVDELTFTVPRPTLSGLGQLRGADRDAAIIEGASPLGFDSLLTQHLEHCLIPLFDHAEFHQHRLDLPLWTRPAEKP
jgi:hypothetical protein